MKELSALTSIPDRTIRYYIDDGVFIPESYTENYTGRRSYNFTDNDVAKLKQIATLRKYEFSLKDIQSIFSGEVKYEELLKNHIETMKENVDSNVSMINTLINTIQNCPTNAKTLCDSLNNPEMAQVMIPAIDSRAPYQRMYKKTKKKNTLLILAIIVLIIATLILNLSVFTTNAECIVSSDYSSLIYNQNVYLALDYGDFEAKHYKTIAKNVTVNGEKTFEHLLCVDNLEAVDDSPINEMLYLQTDYDYNFPNGNPDRFYVEKSVYSKYQSILEDFQPTTFFIYKDKYDTTLPWVECDGEFFRNITSCTDKAENAKSINDWFTKGGTENSYFICGYQKPFYKDLGEIKIIDGGYYYLPYEHTNISKYTTGETTQTFYKIDNDYTERLGKLIGKISE